MPLRFVKWETAQNARMHRMNTDPAHAGAYTSV